MTRKLKLLVFFVSSGTRYHDSTVEPKAIERRVEKVPNQRNEEDTIERDTRRSSVAVRDSSRLALRSLDQNDAIVHGEPMSVREVGSTSYCASTPMK